MQLLVIGPPAAASGAIDQSDRLFLSHRFKTEEEALSIANASNVGLAGEGVALEMGQVVGGAMRGVAASPVQVLMMR